MPRKSDLLYYRIPYFEVDKQLRAALDQQNNATKENKDKPNHIFGCNKISPNYKQGETTIKQIIRRNISSTNPQMILILSYAIYIKCKKSCFL